MIVWYASIAALLVDWTIAPPEVVKMVKSYHQSIPYKLSLLGLSALYRFWPQPFKFFHFKYALFQSEFQTAPYRIKINLHHCCHLPIATSTGHLPSRLVCFDCALHQTAICKQPLAAFHNLRTWQPCLCHFLSFTSLICNLFLLWGTSIGTPRSFALVHTSPRQHYLAYYDSYINSFHCS